MRGVVLLGLLDLAAGPQSPSGSAWGLGAGGNPSSHASTASAVCVSTSRSMRAVSAAVVTGLCAWLVAVSRRICSSCCSTRCKLEGLLGGLHVRVARQGLCGLLAQLWRRRRWLRARGVWCGWVVALGCAARGVFGVRCLCQCRKWCANPLHIRLVESSGV